MHDGTVRDVCFIEDMSNKSSLLVSGGAGDCKIYVTDCATGTPFQALSGHTGESPALPSRRCPGTQVSHRPRHRHPLPGAVRTHRSVTDCATGTPFQALSGHTGQFRFSVALGD